VEVGFGDANAGALGCNLAFGSAHVGPPAQEVRRDTDYHLLGRHRRALPFRQRLEQVGDFRILGAVQQPGQVLGRFLPVLAELLDYVVASPASSMVAAAYVSARVDNDGNWPATGD
jgi:hypothetical protein